MLRLRILARWRKESVEEHMWHLFTEFTEELFVMIIMCEGPDVGPFLIFTEKGSIYADEDEDEEPRRATTSHDEPRRATTSHDEGWVWMIPKDDSRRLIHQQQQQQRPAKRQRTSNGHQRHDISDLSVGTQTQTAPTP
ncbi:hypothetical protein E4U44_002447 [Claviceps purpurea]|nr:hypothetical protein E4U44_002447 [Claviceps purpurea]